MGTAQCAWRCLLHLLMRMSVVHVSQLYINGPYWINDDLTLRPNPGSWGRLYGLLFIEQPISVGFSRGGG